MFVIAFTQLIMTPRKQKNIKSEDLRIFTRLRGVIAMVLGLLLVLFGFIENSGTDLGDTVSALLWVLSLLLGVSFIALHYIFTKRGRKK